MADKAEQTITVDGTEYKSSELSETARAAATNINVTDNELRRLRIQTDIAKAARQAFVQKLTQNLPEKG